MKIGNVNADTGWCPLSTRDCNRCNILSANRLDWVWKGNESKVQSRDVFNSKKDHDRLNDRRPEDDDDPCLQPLTRLPNQRHDFSRFRSDGTGFTTIIPEVPMATLKDGMVVDERPDK
jgi:hypothetical protein